MSGRAILLTEGTRFGDEPGLMVEFLREAHRRFKELADRVTD